MQNIDISREYEERYFSEAMEIVNENRTRTEEGVNKLNADIEHMWDQYFAGDVEIWVPLQNAIALCKQQSKALNGYMRASKKPYFGRICFIDEETGEAESLYIGRYGINKNLTTQVVADWRAPVSNVYYENGLGKCSFLSPDDEDINIDLTLKRTFDIEDAKLLGYVDSEVVANDELLTKYLARNKQAVLGEIIATIQKEQNDIIRRSPYKNVIVQGAAGSGKTTVAMHRISYILYNYADTITPDRFYIVGSNRILLNYITGVLPELDVEGVKQLTLEELFTELVGDAWDEEKHKITAVKTENRAGAGMNNTGKGSTERFMRISAFCDVLESRCIIRGDVILNRDCFREGVRNGKTGVFDKSEETGTSDYLELQNGRMKCEEYGSCVKLLPVSYINRLLKENPSLSVQKKIDLLNEKLADNVEFELTAHGSRYTEKETVAIRKAFKGYFGPEIFKRDIFDIYSEFQREQHEDDAVGSGSFDVYDLAALAYIYKRVVEKSAVKMSQHVVIDEAQDYGMMAYRALDFCLENATYTVMGDISQNIRYDSGLNSWDELKSVLLRNAGDSFCTLRKSYRNTVEISEFATKILDHGSFDVYPVEPIIRHGEEPSVLRVDKGEVIDSVIAVCRSWQDDGYGTLAIVCRTSAEAAEVHDELTKAGLELMENDPERAEFGNGIMVLSVEFTKGLEFDAVLLYEPDRDRYPSDDRHAKLLYVAATRALHELCVVCSGDLTGLIADAIPEDKLRHVIDADPAIDKDDRTPGEQQREIRKQAEAEKEFLKRQTLSAADRRREDDNSWATRQLKNRGEEHEDLSEAMTEGACVEQNAGPAFASAVPESIYVPAGHAAPSLAVKWVNKQPGGIFLQSRFGIMRVLPISAGIVRITFVKGSDFKASTDDLTHKFGMLKGFTQRENPKALEISAANWSISIDKQTGAVVYKDGKGRELLKEKAVEARVVTGDGRTARGFTNFMPKKKENWYALNTIDDTIKYIGDAAMWVTPSDGGLPLVIIKDTFGILPVSEQPVGFNNLSGYGTSLLTQGDSIDYYFMVGTTQEMLQYYRKLVQK